MKIKRIIFDKEAREKLEAGINAVANAVSTTLGPLGRNVIIEREHGGPMVTVDGVSVAKEIKLADKFEDMGAQLCIEVAGKTNEIAGDGTSSSVVLAQALVNEGLKYTSMGGNPLAVKRGIELGVEQATQIIKELAIPITTKEQTKYIATISGKDKEIGNNIADAIEQVGKSGLISIEESNGRDTYLELVEGFELDSGYMNPYFITHPENMAAQYSNPYILITDKRIDDPNDLATFLNNTVVEPKKPILMVVDDVSPECLGMLIKNKVEGGFPIVMVKAPGYGSSKQNILEDISIMVGATFVSNVLGTKLSSIQKSQLGTAKRIVVTHNQTVIYEAGSDKELLKGRIDQLNGQIDATESVYLKDELQKRVAKLTGGIAILRLGASTETELREKQHRYEDAISATKAALEEGIVPGGGLTLLKVASKLSKKGMSKDEAIGLDILKSALLVPCGLIASNAGYDSGVVLNALGKARSNKGFDASTGKYVDLMKAGIIDPAKVCRSSIQNAASIAGMVLTSKTLIVNEEEK